MYFCYYVCLKPNIYICFLAFHLRIKPLSDHASFLLVAQYSIPFSDGLHRLGHKSKALVFAQSYREAQCSCC